MTGKKVNKILVIKIGTSILADERGWLNEGMVKNIATQVDQVRKNGFKVVIVSSGAIAVGMQLLRLNKRPEFLPEIQACAAVGQAQLIKLYDTYFRKLGVITAQVLLTQDDVNDRARYLNSRNTLFSLLDKGIVPIVNENDTVSTEEIKFGDNDRLSSLVASLIEADKLIVLSDVDGLYISRGKDKAKKDIIRRVDRINEQIEFLAGTECSKFGVGGMSTKLQAAKIAVNAGICCVLVNGRKKNILLDVIEGKDTGTVFAAMQPKISARKRWIAYSSKSRGIVKVDSGAKDALAKKNRSLLASGVTGCTGRFSIGEGVSIVDEKNKEFAKGISNYSSSEINKIKGHNTKEIERLLGYKYYDEVIHRDNLVILN